MGLEEKLPEGILTTSLETLVNWGRENSTWPLLFGLACCAIEMIATGTSRHDISRYGSELFRASPRQADLMIVSGRVSNKMAPVIKRLYDQMSEPKWVIAMGICASAGGPFNNYAIIQGRGQDHPSRCLCARLPAAPGGAALRTRQTAREAGQRKLPKYAATERFIRPPSPRADTTSWYVCSNRCRLDRSPLLSTNSENIMLDVSPRVREIRNLARPQPASGFRQLRPLPTGESEDTTALSSVLATAILAAGLHTASMSSM
jgi:NADH-quinone oxidoreductase B subunit